MTNEEFWELEERYPMLCSISSDCSTMTFKILSDMTEYILITDDAYAKEQFSVDFRGSKDDLRRYLQVAMIPEHSALSLIRVLTENDRKFYRKSFREEISEETARKMVAEEFNGEEWELIKRMMKKGFRFFTGQAEYWVE